VWVDGGSYRNFILDHDITRRQRDFINLNCLSVRRTLSCDGIAEDMQSLKLIGSSQVKRHRRESNLSDTTLFTNQRNNTRISKNSAQLIKKEFYEKFGNKMAIDEETAIGSDRDYLTQSVIKSDGSYIRGGEGGGVNSNIGSSCDEKRLNDEMDYSKNQLTERVLQWLDLAGRNTSNARNENEIPKANQSKRRIFTASDTHKKKTVPQVYLSPKHTTVTPIQQAPPVLRRTESVHHLSLTFNDDVGQLQNGGAPVEASAERHALSFGEFFPTAYRCSRKFLAYRNGGTKVRNVASANSHNMQQAEHGRKSFQNKPKRIDSIENQYRSMIQRQILENNCNTQLAKRQLHIFMPSLPKKTIVTTLPNSTNGDCDSCLSTILSSGVMR
jgi:hypothetical protein